MSCLVHSLRALGHLSSSMLAPKLLCKDRHKNLCVAWALLQYSCIKEVLNVKKCKPTKCELLLNSSAKINILNQYIHLLKRLIKFEVRIKRSTIFRSLRNLILNHSTWQLKLWDKTTNKYYFCPNKYFV